MKPVGKLRGHVTDRGYCRALTFACDEALFERVDAVARDNGMSRSAALRAMIQIIVPAFETMGPFGMDAARSRFNYLLGKAWLALIAYLSTGEAVRLHHAIEALSTELQRREDDAALAEVAGEHEEAAHAER
jgi:hypothetical protein